MGNFALKPHLIEPEAANLHASKEVALAYSSAISLKRIADVLSGTGLRDMLTQPVNSYGESFTDALQMSLVRGQQGIDRI